MSESRERLKDPGSWPFRRLVLVVAWALILGQPSFRVLRLEDMGSDTGTGVFIMWLMCAWIVFCSGFVALPRFWRASLGRALLPTQRVAAACSVVALVVLLHTYLFFVFRLPTRGLIGEFAHVLSVPLLLATYLCCLVAPFSLAAAISRSRPAGPTSGKGVA